MGDFRYGDAPARACARGEIFASALVCRRHWGAIFALPWTPSSPALSFAQSFSIARGQPGFARPVKAPCPGRADIRFLYDRLRRRLALSTTTRVSGSPSRDPVRGNPWVPRGREGLAIPVPHLTKCASPPI